MDAAIIVALIALAGVVGNVALTYVLTARSERRRELEKSDAIWARYRAALALAGDELANRIDNICAAHFSTSVPEDRVRTRSYIARSSGSPSTSAGMRVLRGYTPYPDPRHAREVQKLEEVRRRVADTFNTDRYGAGRIHDLAGAQRAVGEVMITRERDVIDIMGVAGFVSKIERFRPWLSRMEELIRTKPSDWDPGER